MSELSERIRPMVCTCRRWLRATADLPAERFAAIGPIDLEDLAGAEASELAAWANEGTNVMPARIENYLAVVRGIQKDFTAGDAVFHRPSRERWLLACDQSGDHVVAAGWPETVATADDCYLIRKATLLQRLWMLTDAATGAAAPGAGGFRGSLAKLHLEALTATLTPKGPLMTAGNDSPALSPEEVARLDELIPAARAAHDQLFAAMVARGWFPFIGAVGRSKQEQAAAIARGTTSKNENIDWHMLFRAVDYRARLADGSEDLTTHNEPFFLALYQETQKIPGMRSLAYHSDGSKLLINGKVWDAGHVEFRSPYDTLAEAVDAEAPSLAVA